MCRVQFFILFFSLSCLGMGGRLIGWWLAGQDGYGGYWEGLLTVQLDGWGYKQLQNGGEWQAVEWKSDFNEDYEQRDGVYLFSLFISFLISRAINQSIKAFQHDMNVSVVF